MFRGSLPIDDAGAPPVEDADRQLARRWQQGDTAAYTELVQRHLDPLRRFLLSRCGNDADADDLCQEVFLTVCRKIANYDPVYPFTAWLYTLARRAAVDHWRRRRPTEALDDHGGVDESDPASLHEAQDAAQAAWAKVRKLLPEAQATVLWLKVQESRSIEEIAETLELTPTNVKVMLFRARQRLARDWNAQDETQPISENHR